MCQIRIGIMLQNIRIYIRIWIIFQYRKGCFDQVNTDKLGLVTDGHHCFASISPHNIPFSFPKIKKDNDDQDQNFALDLSFKKNY